MFEPELIEKGRCGAEDPGRPANRFITAKGCNFPVRALKIPCSFPAPDAAKPEKAQTPPRVSRQRWGGNRRELRKFPVFSLFAGNFSQRAVRSGLPTPPFPSVSRMALAAGSACWIATCARRDPAVARSPVRFHRGKGGWVCASVFCGHTLNHVGGWCGFFAPGGKDQHG